MDVTTIISICTFSILLTQFLLWKYIAGKKSYESEKGKNLATKEDIGEITKDIETIKNQISFEKLRENEYLFERKSKLMSFIPVGIAHKHLLLKVLNCYNRLNDLEYIRDLYNEIYLERLKAETIFYECISYNENVKVLNTLSDYIAAISDVSSNMIKAIHHLELNATNRRIFVESKLNSIDAKNKIDEIDENLKKSFESYDKNKKLLEDSISKAISNYSAFICVLYNINYHQKK